MPLSFLASRQRLAVTRRRCCDKNLRALLADWFGRMDLVMRQDFEVQRKLLEQAQTKLAALEARIAELERRANSSEPR